MKYFPIFVDCEQLNVLVVGGGEVATRKVELMLKTPANITLVSPRLTPTLEQLAQQNQIRVIDGMYQSHLLQDQQLVFVATADQQLNQAISAQAKTLGIFANVVDSPELCHFITPSIIDRSPITFAISSEGQAPVLIRYWRAKLETLVPQSLGQLARFAGKKRQQIKQQYDSVAKRRRFWELFFSDSRSDDPEQQLSLFDSLAEQISNDQEVAPEVWVVKTPKHPDLLTLADLRNMQRADIGFYQPGTPSSIIELLRRDSERQVLSTHWQQQIDESIAQGAKVCLLTAQLGSAQQAYLEQLKSQGIAVNQVDPS